MTCVSHRHPANKISLAAEQLTIQAETCPEHYNKFVERN